MVATLSELRILLRWDDLPRSKCLSPSFWKLFGSNKRVIDQSSNVKPLSLLLHVCIIYCLIKTDQDERDKRSKTSKIGIVMTELRESHPKKVAKHAERALLNNNEPC